jgi:hypothetical protein
MKKQFIIAAIALVSLAGCKKEPAIDFGENTFNSTITGTLVNGNPAISKVEATIIYDVIASGSYANGGFSITLPETVESSLCDKASDAFKGAKVSDRNAMIADIFAFDSYDAAGKYKGAVLYQKEEAGLTDDANFIYADRNVKINGKYEPGFGTTETEFKNLILKKGWNIVYVKNTARGKFVVSNQEISGLKWILFDFYAE